MKNFFKNLSFLKNQWKKLPMDKLAWLWNILFVLFSCVSAVLLVLVPSRAIVAVQDEKRFLIFLGLVAGLGVSLLITNFLKRKTFSNNFLFRIFEGTNAGGKSITLPAELMEGPESQAIQGKISQAVWRGNTIGVESFLTNMRDIVVALANTVLYILLSAKLAWTWIPLILFPAIGQGIFLIWETKKFNQTLTKQEAFWNQKTYLEIMALKNEAGKDVRLFPITTLIKKKFGDYYAEWVPFLNTLFTRRFISKLVFWLLCIIRDVVCFIILFKRVQAGMPVSDFVLYMGLILGISAYVREIFTRAADLAHDNQVVSNYRAVFEQPDYDQGNFSATLKPGLHTIQFENVSYSYQADAKDPVYALKNVNLTIHPGEKLALVGINGAGKTTLVKLAAGIYKPTEGRVLFDGIDIREINPRELYEHVAVVFQDVTVVATTMAENIACAPTDAIDQERLNTAVEKAGLGKVVAKLSKGTDSQLTTYLHQDGVVLSGGENQRLMLARALYKGGDLLILDEPTAALDPLAEANIYETYYDLSKNQTAVFISHRLSSTQFCDRVVFLEDGMIAEIGTHEALMQAKGAYHHMFQEQAKYYQAEATA